MLADTSTGGTRVSSASVFCWGIVIVSAIFASRLSAQQHFTIDPTQPGKTFEGVGAVSGGGATSVLLKDYPTKQRDQIMDILFKPNFAASMQTLYVEIGGDGNSTQGTEPTHMRSRTDENYSRGYEWWLMAEAKRRNPQLTLDACAWSCPGWIGDGQFWSQDMADYDVKWIKGLKTHYDLDLDAVGCRNERGAVTQWVKLFRKTLDAAGLQSVRIHAFDNAGEKKWDWIPHLQTDAELASAVNILGNHTLGITPQPPNVQELANKLNKPIWNTEEHVYDGEGRHFADDYALAVGMVHLFNDNYIHHGATKIVNWYLIGSTYAYEPYADQPPAMIAREPWSGHYQLKPAIWAYAHYGQFTHIGWKYVDSGCGTLSGGGSIVTLASPIGDEVSSIAETTGATTPQTVSLNVQRAAGRKLSVWRTDRASMFARQPDLNVDSDGLASISLEPDAIYSISTTTGQQHGEFADVPASRPFPLPYLDDFESYGDGHRFGYLPHHTADICGVFELADRSDHQGHALRQVVDHKPQSWAPEWMPYTVIGDERWTDYEIGCDVYLDPGGWAGVMGRINSTGNGWDGDPDGYYVRMYPDGGCALYLASQKIRGSRDQQLATGEVADFKSNRWHSVKLRFAGEQITVLIDGAETIQMRDKTFTHGLAGLITGGEGTARNTSWFDNLKISRVGDDISQPIAVVSDPLYAK